MSVASGCGVEVLEEKIDVQVANIFSWGLEVSKASRITSRTRIASDFSRWRPSVWRVCTRWRGCPRVSPVPGGRSKRRAFPSTTHANLPRSPDVFHVVSNRTRFGTPSTPSGWTRHEGTGVLFATRKRPGYGRSHRATSLYLRKAKLFDKHMFPAGACFPRLRILLPKRRLLLTKLFSLFEQT